MKLWRSAANRSSSWQPLLREDGFWPEWSSNEPAIIFRSVGKCERNLKGQYDHQVELSIDDICALIEAISTDAIRESPEIIEAGFAGMEDAFIRMLACIKGLRPTVPPVPDTKLDGDILDSD